MPGLRAFLKKEGYDFDSDHRRLARLLEKAVGSHREAELSDAWTRRDDGQPEALYAIPRDGKQAHLLFSFDSARTLASHEWLAAIPEYAPPGAVADLGCGTGSLARYIALRYQERQIVGFDAQSNFIEIARTFPNPAGQIQYWCSQYEGLIALPLKFSVLLSACGIQFKTWPGEGDPRQHDPRDLLPDEPYIPSSLADWFRQQTLPALSAWREIAEGGSLLRCVMRLHSFVGLSLFIETAALAGWRFLPDSSQYVRTSDERFPALEFEAFPSTPASYIGRDALLAWSAGRNPDPKWNVDVLSLLAYRALSRIPQETTSRLYDDGHTMKIETGRLRSGGTYSYQYATTGLRNLEVHPSG
jgi:hypothetical protein